MTRYYMTATKRGAFYIKRSNNEWHLWYNSDYLEGPFGTAQDAAHELANNQALQAHSGEPSSQGVPESLSGWEAI